MAAAVERSLPLMHAFLPDALAGLGAAVGASGYRPPAAWLDRFCLETYVRCALRRRWGALLLAAATLACDARDGAAAARVCARQDAPPDGARPGQRDVRPGQDGPRAQRRVAGARSAAPQVSLPSSPGSTLRHLAAAAASRLVRAGHGLQDPPRVCGAGRWFPCRAPTRPPSSAPPGRWQSCRSALPGRPLLQAIATDYDDASRRLVASRCAPLPPTRRCGGGSTG